MTYNKRFINKFTFAQPDWKLLPSDFPATTKNELSNKDAHHLDAIKLAWLASELGRGYLYRKTARFVLIILAMGISLIGVLTLKANNGLTKTVNASNISSQVKRNIEEVVESTRSAILILTN